MHGYYAVRTCAYCEFVVTMYVFCVDKIKRIEHGYYYDARRDQNNSNIT